MKRATTILITCVGALLALGLVMLLSASVAHKAGSHLLTVQLVSFGLGMVVCLSLALSDYRSLKKFSWVLLAFAALLLLSVFIPHFGVVSHGARRWINLRITTFQPSEFAKLALIITLAWYAERFKRQMPGFIKGLLIPGAFISVILVLILIGKDYGATILLATVSGLMLLVAGVRWRFLIPTGILVVAVFAAAIAMNPVRRARVMVWFNPKPGQAALEYQTKQSVIAFGSGGWKGVGLGEGRQKMGFVPENHTDFILSVIGEELGLVATLTVLTTFLVLLICGIWIAFRARDSFGMLLAFGITSLISLQAAINVGVVTGALPNKGLPLPFISYGGSNLLIMLSCVGLLISVARRAVENPFSARDPEEAEDLVPSPVV
ncbi:MAG: putative lipid II flippase FtsW [Verrucomicrobia bacterium]|nr:putative lipid II flippase FtsW [Verrucomicrobiota bacterium]